MGNLNNKPGISTIQRAIVQSKVRKYRLQNPNNGSITDAPNYENIQPFPLQGSKITAERRGSTGTATDNIPRNDMTIYTGQKPKYLRVA